MDLVLHPRNSLFNDHAGLRRGWLLRRDTPELAVSQVVRGPRSGDRSRRWISPLGREADARDRIQGLLDDLPVACHHSFLDLVFSAFCGADRTLLAYVKWGCINEPDFCRETLRTGAG